MSGKAIGGDERLRSRKWLQKLAQILDPRMSPSAFDFKEIEKVLNVALTCTSSFPTNRPYMRKCLLLVVFGTSSMLTE
ncbi:hypothetical protein J1N35_025480 [Gossypium stocksii]|uniref:Uncharacterized protein n=1 Tax=Gossypium stocksii TaxID=47602 RepID=A0A9D3V6E9_9ROSI|nr:hypothetical protein J1N35_025480 [Gossypium stocksii]